MGNIFLIICMVIWAFFEVGGHLTGKGGKRK